MTLFFLLLCRCQLLGWEDWQGQPLGEIGDQDLVEVRDQDSGGLLDSSVCSQTLKPYGYPSFSQTI